MWQFDPDQSFPWWQKSIAHFLKISTALIKTMEKRILHQCHWNSASKMLNRNHDEGNGHQCQIYIFSHKRCAITYQTSISIRYQRMPKLAGSAIYRTFSGRNRDKEGKIYKWFGRRGKNTPATTIKRMHRKSDGKHKSAPNHNKIEIVFRMKVNVPSKNWTLVCSSLE